MIVVTTENILGKKCKPVGFVSANRTMSIFADTEMYKVQLSLIDQAKRIGADAIVAVRMFSTNNGGTAMYGTAVKFIE